MKRAILLGTTGTAAAVAMLAGGFLAGRPQPAMAKDTPSAAVTIASADTMDRKEVEKIIREYLLANPELLQEVQQALDAKQKEEQRVAQQAIISDARDKIFKSAHDGIVGNPNGKVSIVEFFDYNCGYCKRAIEDMRAMTAADPELRFVLKEFPILRPDSQKASVVSMAFHNMMPGEIRRVPQPAARRPWPCRRGDRRQDRRFARRGREKASRSDEGSRRSTTSSPRPTTSPTSCRSPARPPMWSAARSVGAQGRYRRAQREGCGRQGGVRRHGGLLRPGGRPHHSSFGRESRGITALPPFSFGLSQGRL